MKHTSTVVLAVVVLFSAASVAMLVGKSSGRSEGGQAASVNRQVMDAIQRLDGRLQQLETDVSSLNVRVSQSANGSAASVEMQNRLEQMVSQAVADALPEARFSTGPEPAAGAPISDPVEPRAPVSGSGMSGAASQSPSMIMVSPTPEQNQIFEDLKRRLDEPDFWHGMTFSGLVELDEMKAIPDALQKVIISKAIGKLNRGEVDKGAFLQGIPLASE